LSELDLNDVPEDDDNFEDEENIKVESVGNCGRTIDDCDYFESGGDDLCTSCWVREEFDEDEDYTGSSNGYEED
jgi:hypothetical protein